MKTILVDAVYCLVVPGSTGGFELYEEMHDMLETFPNDKIVVTGADAEETLKFNLAAIPDVYKVFTLSHNPDKTDPDYFNQLLHEFSLDALDCVYFEHNVEAVTSAEAMGIKSYHYDSDEKNLVALSQFLEETARD